MTPCIMITFFVIVFVLLLLFLYSYYVNANVVWIEADK